MAVDLSKLVVRRKISLEELRGRTVAIDAYNVLYQFLSIIRQPDGAPLVDTHGNVTSHLSGLFYRTIDLMEQGIRPIYVFDGVPSMLKQKTIEARMNRRAEAHEAWQKAAAAGNIEEARMHAQAATRITKEIVASARELLDLMCVPYVNAASEGEAQATYMCKNGIAYAVGSQDYDTMLLGAPHVVRNLGFSGRRKLPKRNVYVNVEPELVSLDETLQSLGLTQRQLIWVGIMLGTDFNDGIKGIGPKGALKIARQSKSIEDMERLVMEKSGTPFASDVRAVESMFLEPEVNDVDPAAIERRFADMPLSERLVKFLCDKHDFGLERIEKQAERLSRIKSGPKQKGIGGWIS